MGEERQFWKCSLTSLKNVFSLAVLGSCAEFCLCAGVYTSCILNVYLPILANCACIFLGGEAITFQFIFSLLFYFCSNREGVCRDSNNKQSPVNADEVQCTQMMWHQFLQSAPLPCANSLALRVCTEREPAVDNLVAHFW